MHTDTNEWQAKRLRSVVCVVTDHLKANQGILKNLSSVLKVTVYLVVAHLSVTDVPHYCLLVSTGFALP